MYDWLCTHDAQSLYLHRHFRWRRVGFPIDPAGARLAVATVLPAAEAGRRKKCHLRMRSRIDWRSTDPVSVAVLSLCHHFPDLRRGSDFSGAIRGGLHRFARRGVHRDIGFPLASD